MNNYLFQSLLTLFIPLFLVSCLFILLLYIYRARTYYKIKSEIRNDFSFIINHLDTCIAIYKDIDLKLVYANSSFLKRSGIDLKSNINKSIREIHPQLGEYYSILESVFKSGKPLHLKEYKYPFGSSYDKWWNIQIYPYRNNNLIQGVITISYEITEQIKSRNKAEELANILEEKVKELNTIVDSIPIGLMYIDKDKNVTYINKNAKNQLSNIIRQCPDTVSADVLFQNLKIKYEDGTPLHFEDSLISQALQGKEIFNQLLVVTNPETEKDVFTIASAATNYDRQGKIKGCILIAKDDTERIINEKNLFEHRNLLKSIFSQIPMGLVLYKHPEMTVLDANDAFLSFTETLRVKDDIIGLKPSQFIHGWKEKRHEKSKASLDSLVSIGKRYYDIQTRPIIEDGLIRYWLEISNDITQQINYTKEIEELSKIKEEFFANVSHEFRTPLTVILATIQLMSKMYENNNENRTSRELKYIKTMKHNCFRLLRLINNLLEITRIDSGHFSLHLENYNIVNVIEDFALSISNFANQRGIHLEFDTDLEEKIIAIDFDKIEKVILNLLSNAIKFTNKGGKISVYVKEAENGIQISVKDTGVGIPKEKLESIFERFVQVDNLLNRKQEGSGIGLSLVKSLIELHNGTISVCSEEGIGTEFIVTLPDVIEHDKGVLGSIESRSYNVLDSKDIELSDIYESA